jgi:tetratricopeptide (TPR) repeat protein
MIFNLKIAVFFILAFFIPLLHHYTPRPVLDIPKQQSAFNVRKEVLLFSHLGQKRVLSDALWLQTIIESDLEHYQKKDLSSWMYLRFDTILSLDPLFLTAYRFGAQYLSVVKDDEEGASQLFERGLAYYPNDFQLNYFGGIHHYFELNDSQKAIEYLEKITDHPDSPPYLSSLIARMKANQGELKLAYTFLANAYERTKDERLKARYFHSLYAIKAEMDLDCLNSKDSGCSSTDLEGKKYILEEKKFRAQKKWTRFRIYRKTSNQ